MAHRRQGTHKKVSPPVFFGYNRAQVLREFSAATSVFVLPELAFDIPLASHLVVLGLPPTHNDPAGLYGILATTPVRLERLLDIEGTIGVPTMRSLQNWDQLERRITILTGPRDDTDCFTGMKLGEDEWSLEQELQQFFDLPIYLFRAHRQGTRITSLLAGYYPVHHLVLPTRFDIFAPEQPCLPAHLVILADERSLSEAQVQQLKNREPKKLPPGQ